MFKEKGNPRSPLEVQYHMALALDTLYASEYTHLRRLALKRLSNQDDGQCSETLIRLTMYEILTGMDMDR